MYPNYRYTPQSKGEKDNKKSPSKNTSSEACIPKETPPEMIAPEGPESSYKLPPSPPWNKTSFENAETEETDLSDPVMDQVPSVEEIESFFDQAGANDGVNNDAVKGDLTDAAKGDASDIGTNDVAIYNAVVTFGTGYGDVTNGTPVAHNGGIASNAADDATTSLGDNTGGSGDFLTHLLSGSGTNEYCEMIDWDFGNFDSDAGMRDFDFRE